MPLIFGKRREDDFKGVFSLPIPRFLARIKKWFSTPVLGISIGIALGIIITVIAGLIWSALQNSEAR